MSTSTARQPVLSSGESSANTQPHRSLLILKTLLYILASLVLAFGLIAGLSLMASAANVHNLLLPLQLLGNDVVVNLIRPYLQGLVSGLGAATLVISSVLGLLLCAVGRLLGYIAVLEVRLARLEASAGTAV